MISDGGGSFNLPEPMMTFLAKLNEIRKRGCWVCRVCFYIEPVQGSDSGEIKVFEDLCKRLEAPFVKATVETYQRVFSSTINQLQRNRGVLKI